MDLCLINIFLLLSGIVVGYHVHMWRISSLWKTVQSAVLGEETKMVLVVRKDLKMGSGKVAAQCAHAAVANVEMLSSLGKNRRDTTSNRNATLSDSSNAVRSSVWYEWYAAWRQCGYPKIVVQCMDENDLISIARKCKEESLPFYLVRDAGRTQIAAGSKTVVAVGPAPKSLIDGVTGHLKLY